MKKVRDAEKPTKLTVEAVVAERGGNGDIDILLHTQIYKL